MFEGQTSVSKISFLITMEENAQVVPACSDIILSCVTDDHDAVGEILGNSNNFRTDARIVVPSVSGQRSQNVGQMSSEYFEFLDMKTRKDRPLQEAVGRALVFGDMTPLIKEELKYSIQSKRLKEGKEELKVEFTHPPPDELTTEEMEKVEKRKEQNRMAARRFRDRQRSKGEVLQKEVNRLVSEQSQLRFQLAQVTGERDRLRKTLESHLAVCPLSVLPQLFIQDSQLENT